MELWGEHHTSFCEEIDTYDFDSQWGELHGELVNIILGEQGEHHPRYSLEFIFLTILVVGITIPKAISHTQYWRSRTLEWMKHFFHQNSLFSKSWEGLSTASLRCDMHPLSVLLFKMKAARWLCASVTSNDSTSEGCVLFFIASPLPSYFLSPLT